MKAALLAVILASGCGATGGSFDPKPGQAEVVDLIWHQFYGQHDAPPPVEWVNATSLWENVVGFTYGGWKIVLAADDSQICGTAGCGDVYRFSSTALTHELMHYRTWIRTGGDVDPLHKRGDWDLEADTSRAIFQDEQDRREAAAHAKAELRTDAATAL